MRLVRTVGRFFFFLVATSTAAAVVLHTSAMWRQSEVAVDVAPGEFVHAVDTEMHYQELGAPSATTVVLIGGTGAWSGIWKREMAIAADAGFHAVAIDLPPFGYSTRPTTLDYTREAQAGRIVSALRELALGKIHIVAHSFGAAPAITAAASIPERTSSLILVDPALGFTTPGAKTVGAPSWTTRILFGVRPLRLLIADIGTQPALMKTAVQRVIFKKEMATDDVVAIFQRQMHLRGKSDEIGKWVADFLLVRDAQFVEDPGFFRRIEAPVTLVWGERDDITPLWQGEMLEQLLPSAKLVVVPGVGHIPQIEDPPAFQRLLKELLEKYGP